jgi:membrane protein implicated in regulation of membrane protease activity
MSPTILWLIAGAVFIAVEIFGVPGIGFLFAGLAALVVGGGIEFGLIDADGYLVQFVLFFLISITSAIVLWKRLRDKRPPSYSNMVGTEAHVAAPGLAGKREGQVKWSGTLMRARLADDVNIDVLPEGETVIIRHVDGNLLHVVPKH